MQMYIKLLKYPYFCSVIISILVGYILQNAIFFSNKLIIKYLKIIENTLQSLKEVLLTII
jgi:hypothetical protein